MILDGGIFGKFKGVGDNSLVRDLGICYGLILEGSRRVKKITDSGPGACLVFPSVLFICKQVSFLFGIH